MLKHVEELGRKEVKKFIEPEISAAQILRSISGQRNSAARYGRFCLLAEAQSAPIFVGQNGSSGEVRAWKYDSWPC